MAEIPTVMAQAPVIPVPATKSSKSIEALRKDYERLATACTVAHDAGDKPKYAELMAAKKAAFALWHEAVVAARHAKRDAAKAK